MRRGILIDALALLSLWVITACYASECVEDPDGGSVDAGEISPDAGVVDASPPDAAPVDAARECPIKDAAACGHICEPCCESGSTTYCLEGGCDQIMNVPVCL